MLRLQVSVLAIATLLGPLLSACASSSEPSSSASDAIMGGTEAPNEHPSLGVVRDGDVIAGAGTLIAPRVVLTSAAVVYGRKGPITFAIGPVTPDQKRITGTAKTHPSYDEVKNDIAYVVLDTPITDVVPAKIASHAKSDKCGFVAVGYGRTGTVEPLGIRKRLDVCVDEARDAELYGHGKDGAHCFGDAGSGLFASGTGGDTIVGFNVGIEGLQCTTKLNLFFVNLDRFAPFVQEALAAGK
jgi:hypothetical protein